MLVTLVADLFVIWNNCLIVALSVVLTFTFAGLHRANKEPAPYLILGAKILNAAFRSWTRKLVIFLYKSIKILAAAFVMWVFV